MDSYRQLAAIAVVTFTFACSSSKDSSYGGMGGSAPVGGSGAGGSPDNLGACSASGTLTVTNNGASAYVIDGSSNPTLTLCRGDSYTFAVSAAGHPFYIKTVQGAGTANAYDTGVTNNGADVGDVTFIVPTSAPDTLYYNCSIHAAMSGTLEIIDRS